jgi:cell division protein FtsQ
MKNIPWKKIGITLLWVLGIATIGISLAFTEIKQQDLKCKKITINVNKSDENYFINKQDISAIIQFGGDSLLNKYVNKINVKRLEKLIEANKYISNAEVFIDLNGELFVNVQQRKPLLRIFTSDQHSFYLDEHGLKMPLSPNYSAKVLSANGNIQEIYGGIYDSVKNPLLKDLFELTKFIQANEFWDAQIEQIFIEENKDITLIPRVGNQKIIFGNQNSLNCNC